MDHKLDHQVSSPQYKSNEEDTRLFALKKPIYHLPLDDNKKEQLPEDVRSLSSRLYDITIEYEGIAPREGPGGDQWATRAAVEGVLV